MSFQPSPFKVESKSSKAESKPRPHIMALKLNENAASGIEIGLYGRSITTLVQALKLISQPTDLVPCLCPQCWLVTCMAFSDTLPCRQCCDHDENGGGFVYRKPIRATPHSVQAGHYMGRTLRLIIAFNLALAYHLEALALKDRNLNRTDMKKALQLYEVANQWQTEKNNNSSAGHLKSPRFTMVLLNNMAQIHRTLSSDSKYLRSLELLLKAVMVMVDCDYKEKPFELDGFLRNTSRLILISQTASAA